jgi:hypothetical protein
MKKAGLLLTVALVASGCTYGNWGGGPRTPVEREIRIESPRLSPDGKSIIFAFRYKQYPWKIAVVPSDPAATTVSVLHFPPMDDWVQPNFGPDPQHFAVVSYCTHDKCYEGAKGYNVWLATAQPKDNLKRITPDVADVRRADPMFGATADDVYWVLSDNKKYPDVHMDVGNRYVAHIVDGKEKTLFPDMNVNGNLGHGFKDPANLVILSAHGAGRFDEHGYYFAARVNRGNCDAAKAAVKQVGFLHSALLRYADGSFELVEPVEVEYVDAPRGARGYVAMAHHFIKEHTNAVADFHSARDGHALWAFRFHSQAYGVSVSENLSTVVFSGERSYIDEKHIWHPRLQEAIYLWREGMTEAVDLNIPERVKAKVEAEIAAEKQARISTPNSPSNLLTENTVFAVDNGHFAVQD